MKNAIALLAASLVLASTSFAETPTAPAATETTPVVVSVVNPSNLPTTFQRATVTVEFSVDATGQPREVAVISKADRDTRKQVVKAFKQWTFDPSTVDNAKRYALPIEIVVPAA